MSFDESFEIPNRIKNNMTRDAKPIFIFFDSGFVLFFRNFDGHMWMAIRDTKLNSRRNAKRSSICGMVTYGWCNCKANSKLKGNTQ